MVNRTFHNPSSSNLQNQIENTLRLNHHIIEKLILASYNYLCNMYSQEKLVIEKLDSMLAKAKKIKRRLGVFYVLKAFVLLGRGWHKIKEVHKKAMEISNNPKLKYYPIQDAIKHGLAELDKEQKEKSVGELKVKLKDELYNTIEKEIDKYIQELEKIKE